MKRYCYVLLLCFVLCGCSHAANEVTSFFGIESSAVKVVKYSHPKDFPDSNYSAAFSEFFAEPKWLSYEGTIPGPDNDGDGVSDSERTECKVVEFDGKVVYNDKVTNVKIYFDSEEDSPEPICTKFDDIPQNQLVGYLLVKKAFTGE